ncbi:AcrR family transcriptional regulator [Sphingobium sp. OAS761]|uniref:TetR/AcrR family transcriptional regulator n=1 Tax=Sphingobium sp. OAS761 TaxID=2817901 RepID=UPI00209FD419|nr:TetR/AcrR family transcriptional regulator [Sphingobium sp. OAS761]MCP1469347.1 AcrR family transcriptional regulator [Sphingobium sp. OAS761]
MTNGIDPAPQEGTRARKRRETLARITEAGITLFLEKGYDATTLDDIAARAGISRRNFFYYFKSKDEILLSLQSGMGEMIVDALRQQPVDQPPLEAVRDAVLKVCAIFPTDEMIAIDQLMRTNPVVQARKQASMVEHEATLYAALREKWPAPDQAIRLRMVAMMAMGAIRLATDSLHHEGGKRAFTDILAGNFAALRDTA